MPVQNSPTSKNTRSEINQAVLNPTASAPLESKLSLHQLSQSLDRGPPMEGAEPSRPGGPRSAGSSETLEAPNLGLSNKPLVSQAKPNFLKMMHQTTKFMGQLTQAVSPRDNSRAPAFKTPSMKAPYSFVITQAYKLGGFLQSCQAILHNDPENFFSDRKKDLYLTSFLIVRGKNWI
ncbi:hypothetical protein O181_069968 [Austropuccinia psidii MF-1]|uniref:Uncharacterized protein n=1 Tax=Austropuccinia psidii MF-1 TaxID=1389203 RepID=A0A9Q3EY67_9BASI|nr:hypothetical protein [Austropuccinia psidii MF-1]